MHDSNFILAPDGNLINLSLVRTIGRSVEGHPIMIFIDGFGYLISEEFLELLYLKEAGLAPPPRPENLPVPDSDQDD